MLQTVDSDDQSAHIPNTSRGTLALCLAAITGERSARMAWSAADSFRLSPLQQISMRFPRVTASFYRAGRARNTILHTQERRPPRFAHGRLGSSTWPTVFRGRGYLRLSELRKSPIRSTPRWIRSSGKWGTGWLWRRPSCWSLIRAEQRVTVIVQADLD
jgi:hypothetical protein